MSKRKVGIIGTGFIGIVHLEALRRLPQIDVIAICDTRSDINEIAEKYGICHAYQDYKCLIDDAKPDIIHICTPNNLHYAIAKYALENGVNVFCEKPFTVTIEEARELTQLAKKYERKTALNFHNRFWPMTMQMRAMAKNQELGDIITVHGHYLQDWLQLETDYSWRLHSSMAGKTRAVSDIGSHWLDLAEYTSGHKISRVCARFKTVYQTRMKSDGEVKTFQKNSTQGQLQRFDIDTEDCAVLLMEFDNGAIGNLVISQMFAGAKNKISLFIGGVKSSVQWDSEDSNNILIGRRDGANLQMTKDPSLLDEDAAVLSSYPGGHVEGFADAIKQCFDQFYRGYINNENVETVASFDEGLHNMQLCEAIWKSAQKEEWVDVMEV